MYCFFSQQPIYENMHNTGWSKRKSRKKSIQFLFLLGRKERTVIRKDRKLQQQQNCENETRAGNVKTVKKRSLQFTNFSYIFKPFFVLQNNHTVYISGRMLGVRKVKKCLIGRIGYQLPQMISSCQQKFSKYRHAIRILLILLILWIFGPV